MDDYDQHIDKIIRDAREKGAFNDLSGKGKPFQWDDDALVPDEMRMANKVMKDAGFLPEWILESKEIDAGYQAALRSLELARAARADGRLDYAGWQSALAEFTRQVVDLNRRILRYNLRAPNEQLQRGLYSTEPPGPQTP